MPVTEKGKEKALAFLGVDGQKADDAAVDTAIKNYATEDEIKDLRNRAEAGDRAAEALADADLERFANRIGDNKETRAFYREGLLANREGTLTALEGLPEPKAQQQERPKPLHNRAEAKTPELSPDEKAKKKDEVRAGKVANRARELRSQNPSLQNRAAFDQAESEIPAE